MDTAELSALLSSLPLSAVRHLPTVTSTNDVAREWLAAGAPDLALIAADEQTAGRGQRGRTWHSPASTCIAFSLVLRGKLDSNPALISRITALGALAVCDALAAMNLSAQIKWPNDVLLDKRKVAGVLAEGSWAGDRLEGIVLGIGVNVHASSVDGAMAKEGTLRFPAVSLAEIAGFTPDRWAILEAIVRRLIHWRTQLYQPIFLETWNNVLAFRGEPVQVVEETAEDSKPVVFEGILAGLAEDGALKLRTPTGEELIFHAGDVRLLPHTAASSLPGRADG